MLKKNRPFFVYVPFLATHEPWEALKEYIDKYSKKGLTKSISTLIWDDRAYGL